ncbi:MAG: sigma-54-dependent Fis family transcriptional regulator [Ignavibacteria bacterium]|nr:sigma-54-dependent Fis family transcriptional regulator [Ignavibacteria bacterium]
MNETKAHILIVDDELVICKSCEKIFRRAGHSTASVTSGREALTILAGKTFDVVFTDLKMMDMGGLEVLQAVREQYPTTVVVIITGYATIASAVETMRSGAFDYLPKPFTPAELLAVLDRALEKRKLLIMAEPDYEYSEEGGFEGLVGKSPAMREVYRLVQKVGPTDSTVLIIGESGTGKDLTAKAIHQQSKRKNSTFFAIDISTLSSTLLESELFGHAKGSFTGATADRPGVFEVANHGTIFLDEIGNLPVETQTRLLRVLQEKEFLPVGSTTVKKVDVRLVFATNQNLKQLVGAGKFREDLYYRLNVFPIRLPSLRERREDIPELVQHFLRKYCVAIERETPRVQPEAMELLMNYHWPGNVRELEHAIERLTILIEGNEIEPIHISAALYKTDSALRSMIPKDSVELKNLKKKIRESSVQEIEKLFIEEALIRNNWNVSKAAREVNMQRSNFQALMRKYRITRPDSPA